MEKALLSTSLPLQLWNFVSCGRDKPSHVTLNFITVVWNYRQESDFPLIFNPWIQQIQFDEYVVKVVPLRPGKKICLLREDDNLSYTIIKDIPQVVAYVMSVTCDLCITKHCCLSVIPCEYQLPCHSPIRCGLIMGEWWDGMTRHKSGNHMEGRINNTTQDTSRA